MIKVAIITSNHISIDNESKKGTEIFANIFIKGIAPYQQKEEIDITAFASGDSTLPVKTQSINKIATSLDTRIPDKKHVIFELELLSYAFSQQNNFDLFHVNIGDGDIALPFARFVTKPIIITLHNTAARPYIKKYFNLFKSLKNVYFISVSDAQRKFFPELHYADTIYHGINTKESFTFDPIGGDEIIWAGRAVPKKGMSVVIEIAATLHKKAKIFALIKSSYHSWYMNEMDKLQNSPAKDTILVKEGINRNSLIKEYQKSKLFLFPVNWEEPFGLVMIEAMACGTPVVAYAKGSVPEIIKDGVTGFIVNPSKTNIKGNWIIKKTGIDGLREAVERIYAMSEKEYQKMRLQSRQHVEDNFAVERMVENYIRIYRKVTQGKTLS